MHNLGCYQSFIPAVNKNKNYSTGLNLDKDLVKKNKAITFFGSETVA